MRKLILLPAFFLALISIAIAQKNTNAPKVKADTIIKAGPDSLKILSDKNSELYLRLAQISLNSKDYKSVIAYADSALARDKSAFAYRLKGLGQFNLGLYKETVLSMSLGLEKKENDFALHYYRGLSYHIIDSVNYAEQISKDMLWATTINPLDTMSYYYKGLANFNLSFSANYQKDDKLKECANDLNQFTKLKGNFTAFYIKGAANFLLGGSDQVTPEMRNQYYAEAIKAMTECLKLQPGNDDCLYYRGLSYFISGDFDNVIKDAEILKGKKTGSTKTKGKSIFGKK